MENYYAWRQKSSGLYIGKSILSRMCLTRNPEFIEFFSIDEEFDSEILVSSPAHSLGLKYIFLSLAPLTLSEGISEEDLVKVEIILPWSFKIKENPMLAILSTYIYIVLGLLALVLLLGGSFFLGVIVLWVFLNYEFDKIFGRDLEKFFGKPQKKKRWLSRFPSYNNLSNTPGEPGMTKKNKPRVAFKVNLGKIPYAQENSFFEPGIIVFIKENDMWVEAKISWHKSQEWYNYLNKNYSDNWLY